MYALKPLSRSAVPAALAKAERYRLLNEPAQAASICEDVLRVEPGHPTAVVTLLLALTDQFGGSEWASALARARALLPSLPSDYDRAYYAGLIAERRALAQLASDMPGSGFLAFEGFQDAMRFFEAAEATRPPDNDDAILRWNSCARVLMRNPHLKPREAERDVPLALE